MKLAEALNERAHLSQRLQDLRERIILNAIHQEGNEPAENPNDLLKEFNECSARFDGLVVRINQTNNKLSLSDGMPMLKALATRDSLKIKHSLYRSLASEAVPRQDRYSHSEIKFTSSVQVAEIQHQANKLAQEYRELDIKIQQCNWSHELI